MTTTPSHASGSPALDEQQVRGVLRQVIDPEVGMNIVDLGLVYGVELGDAGVKVQLTMTSAACPMAEMIVDDAYGQLAAALPAETPVEVELVWEPPWTPERMSELARSMFGWQPR